MQKVSVTTITSTKILELPTTLFSISNWLNPLHLFLVILGVGETKQPIISKIPGQL